MNQERRDILIQEYLNGSLNSEQARELLEAMEQSAELRRNFYEQATTDLMLKKMSEPAAEVSKIMRALAQPAVEEPKSQVVESHGTSWLKVAAIWLISCGTLTLLLIRDEPGPSKQAPAKITSLEKTEVQQQDQPFLAPPSEMTLKMEDRGPDMEEAPTELQKMASEAGAARAMGEVMPEDIAPPAAQGAELAEHKGSMHVDALPAAKSEPVKDQTRAMAPVTASNSMNKGMKQLDEVSPAPEPAAEALLVEAVEVAESENSGNPAQFLALGYASISKDTLKSEGEKFQSDFKNTGEKQQLRLMSEVQPEVSDETYTHHPENKSTLVADQPVSTFSIDVDTASYANARRFLNDGRLPPPDAVRVEEFINYFSYDYPDPTDHEPFSASMELAECPWNRDHLLVSIGLQGRRDVSRKSIGSNLVILMDVSGSMNDPDKLPLLKRGLEMLVRELTGDDRVAIVAYAGSSGVVLDPTPGHEKQKILRALESLRPGGSTHGSSGIRLAYQLASDHFIRGGVNRVILASDGDFNVGITDRGELIRFIEEQRQSGVFLSVLGFGTGNLQDATMESLADKGNGSYHYIDSEREARKVLVEELNATLVTIAKDVKLQVEFNPERVREYRLIGYENRHLADRDFDDDKKDAGEIGAGHSVTALYEIVLNDGLKGLRYAKKTEAGLGEHADELLQLKLRYKEPEADASQLRVFVLKAKEAPPGKGSQNLRFAAATAALAQILRGSGQLGAYSLQEVLSLAEEALGEDIGEYRREFLELVRRAAELKGETAGDNPRDSRYPRWPRSRER